MEFAIEKGALQIRKRGNRHKTEGIDLTNQDKNRTLEEKETYKSLGILEVDTNKHTEIDEKISGERENYSKTNYNSRNLTKEINSRAVPLVRYSGPFLKWTKEELQ